MRANHPPKAASQHGNEVAMSIRSEDVAFHIILRTPRSAPHFTHNRRSNQHRGACNGHNGGQKTGTKRPALRVEEHLACQGLRSGVDLGFSMRLGERAPRKFGVVGCEASRGKHETSLTVSAFNFPQFTHTHSNTFFTFTKKPKERGRR